MSLTNYCSVAFFVILSVGSCSSQKPIDRQSPAHDKDRQIIVRLTDNIMQSLAIHDDDVLKQMTATSDTDITGRQIARIILGPEADSILLENWNAQQIRVTFDTTGQMATAHVPVICRASPNRKPVSTQMILNFIRTGDNTWKLSLPAADKSF